VEADMEVVAVATEAAAVVMEEVATEAAAEVRKYRLKMDLINLLNKKVFNFEQHF
jgi:hypothetical protein